MVIVWRLRCIVLSDLKLRERVKEGNDDMFPSLFCLLLCFRLKVPIVYFCLCKSFFVCWKADAQKTDWSINTDTVHTGSSCHEDIKPEKLSLPFHRQPTLFRSPDRLLHQNVPSNEWISLASVSQSESSSHISLSSCPKQPICPRHVSKSSSSPRTTEVSSAKCSTI